MTAVAGLATLVWHPLQRPRKMILDTENKVKRVSKELSGGIFPCSASKSWKLTSLPADPSEKTGLDLQDRVHQSALCKCYNDNHSLMRHAKLGVLRNETYLILAVPTLIIGAVMPREAEPSINERAFVLQALEENIRLDGRALDAFRDIDISFGDDYGVADVQLGKTRY